MIIVGAFWKVIYSFWAALSLTAMYGILGYIAFFTFEGSDSASSLIKFYIIDYSGLITGGACTTLFFLVILILGEFPNTISSNFSEKQLKYTQYSYWLKKSTSIIFGVLQFALYFLIGFSIYMLLEFPVPDSQKLYFTISTGVQFGMGGYVGRRLWCVGLMLKCLETVNPDRELFGNDDLPRLIYIVNIFTFLTFLMTGVHTYFHSIIEYENSTDLRYFIEPMVYLPAILAFPVVILFNFYPRMVVNRIYIRSINQQRDYIYQKLKDAGEDEVTRLKYMIEYQKYMNEEFRYRQRVALSEVPIALTILVAIAAIALRIFFI